MWTAQEPPGPKKHDPNTSDRSLCLVMPSPSCLGTAALLPAGSFVPLCLHPSAAACSWQRSSLLCSQGTGSQQHSLCCCHPTNPQCWTQVWHLLPPTSWNSTASATPNTGGTSLTPCPHKASWCAPCSCAQQQQAQAGHPKQGWQYMALLLQLLLKPNTVCTILISPGLSLLQPIAS